MTSYRNKAEVECGDYVKWCSWGRSPALSGVSLSRSCPGHCREHDDRIIAERRHGFKRHVARPLDRPFIALFHEDGTDESGDRGLVGEDADDLCPALDLAVEPLNGIRAVKLCAMFLWGKSCRRARRLRRRPSGLPAWIALVAPDRPRNATADWPLRAFPTRRGWR